MSKRLDIIILKKLNKESDSIDNYIELNDLVLKYGINSRSL